MNLQEPNGGTTRNVPRVTCIFSIYIRAFRRLHVYTKKYKLLVGYAMVYHERALHNYFISCLRKYGADQHNQ